MYVAFGRVKVCVCVAPRPSQEGPRGPKTSPRAFKEAPRGRQECPRRLPVERLPPLARADVPKGHFGANRSRNKHSGLSLSGYVWVDSLLESRLSGCCVSRLRLCGLRLCGRYLCERQATIHRRNSQHTVLYYIFFTLPQRMQLDKLRWDNTNADHTSCESFLAKMPC